MTAMGAFLVTLAGTMDRMGRERSVLAGPMHTICQAFMCVFVCLCM